MRSRDIPIAYYPAAFHNHDEWMIEIDEYKDDDASMIVKGVQDYNASTLHSGKKQSVVLESMGMKSIRFTSDIS